MAEWSRTMPWRQGHLLTKEAIRTLELIHPKYADDTMVIVASHDCDLAQPPEKEPRVEVLVGRKISVLEGSNTNAKSSRTLHIAFKNTEALFGEFVATEKVSIPKESLKDFVPVTDVSLAPPDLVIFQQWLASRYRRSAFPDEFERRLQESGLDVKIAKAIRPSSMIIKAVYFYVDEGQDVTHEGPADVYVLDIVLLYASEPDSATAEAVTTQVAKKIEYAFTSKLLDKESGNWRSIELRYIDAVSDEAMSVRLSEQYKKLRLDYISLGAETQQPVSGE